MGCNTSKEVGIQPVENTNGSSGNKGNSASEGISSAFEELIKDSAEAAEAATKIQAVFRGHRARKNMKAGDDSSRTSEAANEPTKEELEAEFRADDKELCHAATKIQASFRGHMSRKQQEQPGPNEGEGERSTANKDDDEILDIDLTDPELHNAATKIQASFRGHKVRKEVDGEPGK